MLTFSVNP